MNITRLDTASHEALYRIEDKSLGLVGFIAIHSTVLGPAAGGLRMRAYASEKEAITDVLRLSEGMTYKNAAAELPLGGGKAVVIGNPKTQKTPDLLRAFGQAIQSLKGRYWTAEDMGMTTADMSTLAETTDYVAGMPDGPFASGDPSPVTAQGVFNAVQTGWRHKTGQIGLRGRTVAVQGLGNVGWHLCQHLSTAGAQLIVSDIDAQKLQEAKRAFGAQTAPLDAIYETDADIFAPCAIGGILTAKNIASLRVQLVAGGANNQLPSDAEGDLLHTQGILYAPDFVVNGGGIINVASEILKITEPNDWVKKHLAALNSTLDQILKKAAQQNLCPARISQSAVAEKLL